MTAPIPPTARDSTIFPAELHLLYILLDSNLPTGGFVSSSGLESFAKHGLLSASGVSGGWSTRQVQDINASAGPNHTRPPSIPERLVWFSEDAVRNYARSTSGVVADAWRSVDGLGAHSASWKGKGKADERTLAIEAAVDEVVEAIKTLDAYYEALTLNHVVKRSSMAQGIALLTLLAKGFSEPGYMLGGEGDLLLDDAGEETAAIKEAKRLVLERFRKAIRKGEAAGHLPVCWGLLASASGLSLDRTIHLHLFLHARSLLSSAVRLNIIGPYASSQLLLHPLRTIIEGEAAASSGATTGCIPRDAMHAQEDDEWTWADEGGPAMTWPLGELLMGRHDMQHTRIFNS